MLATRGPFHLEATVRVLQRRPTNLVDVWDGERYLRVIGRTLVAVRNDGTVAAPRLRLEVLRGPRREVMPVVRTILGLDVDPRPLQRLGESVPKLRPIARALRGMRPPRFPDLFETFANVVPFQQVSLDAGVAIVRRIVERFGVRVGEHFAFPTASAVASARVTTLKACGLSTAKAETLLGIARAIADRELTEDMLARATSADAIARLIEIPGIGPWSASIVLLRGLRRLDVFPVGDVGAARGLGALLGARSPADVDRVVERFGELRGYLYFYSLGSALLARGLIEPW